MENKLYTKDSIESLSPLEFTRLRPGVYCGDTSNPNQLLVEIVSNAIDEFRLGHGNKIDVTIKGDIVTVEDYGQGFLVNSKREDGKTILEAAFSVLNTSGKYREDGTYEGTSLGSFGIGSKITTYLSHWLEVITYRDKKYEHIWFKEGVFDKRECGKWDNGTTGTLVQWQASEKFFTTNLVDTTAIKSLFKTITCLCPGLTIALNDNGKKTEYFSKNGIMDLADEAVKDKELIDHRFVFNWGEEKNKVDMVLTYTTNYSSTIVPYVNTGLTESGAHITQIKSLITREFNKFAKEKKLLKEDDDNLLGDDIQEGMYLVFNLTAPNVAYDSQVKSRITKIDLKPFLQPILEAFDNWLVTNEKDAKMILNKAILARKARNAAKKAKDAIRTPKEKNLKTKMELSDKFIDCSSKDPHERKLFILEGVSAGSAAIEARNPKTDCIYLLKGKILSPLKSEQSKILANQELSDLISIIGAGFGDNFDISKAQFDKVVVFSDSDSDGDQICLLLMGFFFTYMRPLVEAGRLYRGAAPLYTVKIGKEEKYFYTDKDYREWLTTNTAKFSVLRGKGVGELAAEDLNRLCFASERFKQLLVSDYLDAKNKLDIFLGTAVTPRRDYIYANAEALGFGME